MRSLLPPRPIRAWRAGLEFASKIDGCHIVLDALWKVQRVRGFDGWFWRQELGKGGGYLSRTYGDKEFAEHVQTKS